MSIAVMMAAAPADHDIAFWRGVVAARWKNALAKLEVLLSIDPQPSEGVVAAHSPAPHAERTVLTALYIGANVTWCE